MAIINKTGLEGVGDFLGFKFRGIHSSNFRIIRVSKSNRYEENLLPSSKDTTIDIPGRDGLLYMDSKYQQKEWTINFAFDDLYEENIRAMKQWLAPKSMGQLMFDEDRKNKNFLLKTDLEEKFNNGVTFTPTAEGVKARGSTPQDNQAAYLYIDPDNPEFIRAGTYYLSGCPANGGMDNWTIALGWRKNSTDGLDKRTVSYDHGNGCKIELKEDGYFDVILIVRKGKDVDLTFNPVLVNNTTKYYTKYYDVKIKGQPKISYIAFDEKQDDGTIKRVYKGEGNLQFVCYDGFAKETSDSKKARGVGVTEDIWIMNSGHVKNVGDIDSPLCFAITSAGLTSSSDHIVKISIGDQILKLDANNLAEREVDLAVIDGNKKLIVDASSVTIKNNKFTYKMKVDKFGMPKILNDIIIEGDFIQVPCGADPSPYIEGMPITIEGCMAQAFNSTGWAFYCDCLFY